MNKQFALVRASIVSVAFTSTVSADVFYDNGDPDGSNGYSNILTDELGGLDRRVADDFLVGNGAGWLIVNVEMNYVWGTPGVIGTATEFLVQFFADDVNGGPGTLINEQVSSNFTATPTGAIFFSREEVIFSVDIDPVSFAANTNYWVSIQPNGDDNGFQLTSHEPHILGDESYVNYEDLTGGNWVKSSSQFGLSGDVSFRLSGVIPTPAALALFGFAGLFGVRRRR